MGKYVKESGFTVVEGLLSILVVAVIGFGGYYVWHAQNASKDKLTDTNSTELTAKSDKPVDPYAGWKTATLQYEKIKFQYPSNWTLKDESESLPKSENDCVYPGRDRITLTSPNNEQVYLGTGIYCIGGNGSMAFDSLPLSSLGQSLYLVFEAGLEYELESPPAAPQYSCLARTSNPETPADFRSRNIFSEGQDESSGPSNQFCYYTRDYVSARSESARPPAQTVSSIKDSQGFDSAKLIFESMKY